MYNSANLDWHGCHASNNFQALRKHRHTAFPSRNQLQLDTAFCSSFKNNLARNWNVNFWYLPIMVEDLLCLIMCWWFLFSHHISFFLLTEDSPHGWNGALNITCKWVFPWELLVVARDVLSFKVAVCYLLGYILFLSWPWHSHARTLSPRLAVLTAELKRTNLHARKL